MYARFVHAYIDLCLQCLQAEAAKKEARERHKSKDVEQDEDVDLAEGDAGRELRSDHVTAKASTSAAAVPKVYRGSLSNFYDLDDRITTLLTLDARDPGTWRLEEIEKQLQSRKESLTFVLTKCDLVPLEVVAAWSAHLSSLGLGQVFPVCSHEEAKHGRKARAGGGIKHLVAHISSLTSGNTKGKSETASQSIALLGIENSGRSSLAQELALALPHLIILNTPAVIAASSRSAHAEDRIEDDDDIDDDDEAVRLRDQEAAHRILIRNSGSIFKVREPFPLVDALMKRVSQVSDLMVTFNVAAFNDLEGFLIGVARTQGRLRKGAVPDTIAACRHILRGWSDGEIGYYSKPPNDVAGLEEARKAIESDASLKGVCLHRREWRQRWSGKELRLTTGDIGMFGSAKLAFSKSDDAMDEDEGEEEDDNEDEDEEEEDGQEMTDEELVDSDPNADTDLDPQEESEDED